MKYADKKKSIHQANKKHINKYKMAHMIAVAEYMRDNARRYGLNPEQMYVVGLLHDIGYLYGHKDHSNSGANLLTNMCFDDTVIKAIRYHGSNLYQLQKYDLLTPTIILTIEADLQIDVYGHNVGFEGRLKDIEYRYGKDSDAAINVASNIEFLKNYIKEQ